MGQEAQGCDLLEKASKGQKPTLGGDLLFNDTFGPRAGCSDPRLITSRKDGCDPQTLVRCDERQQAYISGLQGRSRSKLQAELAKLKKRFAQIGETIGKLSPGVAGRERITKIEKFWWVQSRGKIVQRLLAALREDEDGRREL